MFSDIEVCKVDNPAALDRYIKLPFELPDQRPNRVPPLLADERDLHDSRTNPQLMQCSVERWVAWQGTRPVGRIMGIIHHHHNAAHGEHTARFYQIASIRDPLVVQALIATVEA